MQEEMQCKIINRVNHSGGSGSLMPLRIIYDNSKYMPLALGAKCHEAATRALSANGLSFLLFLDVFGTFPGAPGNTPRLRQGGPAPGAPLLEVLHLSPQD